MKSTCPLFFLLVQQWWNSQNFIIISEMVAILHSSLSILVKPISCLHISFTTLPLAADIIGLASSPRNHLLSLVQQLPVYKLQHHCTS
jgi:hypothetical protein